MKNGSKYSLDGLSCFILYQRITIDVKIIMLLNIINPLPEGLLWFRGMDHEPILLDENKLLNLIEKT